MELHVKVGTAVTPRMFPMGHILLGEYPLSGPHRPDLIRQKVTPSVPRGSPASGGWREKGDEKG